MWGVLNKWVKAPAASDWRAVGKWDKRGFAQGVRSQKTPLCTQLEGEKSQGAGAERCEKTGINSYV